MPEFTEHERARLHAMARQQIRYITITDSLQAANNRRFLALGYLLAMAEVEAWTPEVAQALEDELRATTQQQVDDLFQQVMRETLAPEPAVHCTGHVDYDPASRKPEPDQ